MTYLQAFEERDQMTTMLENVNPDSDTIDTHTFAWGNSVFTSAKYY